MSVPKWMLKDGELVEYRVGWSGYHSFRSGSAEG